MSHLLVKDTFDNFLLSEASINTSCLHSIEGKINHSFYSDEEWAELNEDEKKLISRHEITADLEDFIRVSKELLSKITCSKVL